LIIIRLSVFFFCFCTNYPDSNGGLNGLITRTECIYEKREDLSLFPSVPIDYHLNNSLYALIVRLL
jgi:hypothetical protein